MEQIREAAAQLAAEMERQGRSEALVYFLDDANTGYHPLLAGPFEIVEMLEDIEGDVFMAMTKISLDQMRLIGGL